MACTHGELSALVIVGGLLVDPVVRLPGIVPLKRKVVCRSRSHHTPVGASVALASTS